MSYYYEDTGYAEYGNHDDAYNEYADSYSDCGDSYPDCAESVYNDPDPTYSEPDHHGDRENAPEGHGYQHGEAKYEGESEQHELRELERGEDEIYEYGEWEHEGEYEEERHEPKGLEYERNEGYEPEHNTETNYAGHNAETGYAGHGPYRSEYDDERTSPVAFDDTPTSFEGAYGFTPTMDDPIVYHSPHSPTYVPPIPFSLPPTPSFSPPHTPRTHDAPCSNQRGHVTASKHAYVSDDGCDDDEPRRFKRDGVYEHEGSVYHNTRSADGAFPHPQLVYHEESGEYVHPCFLAPAQIPHHHNNPNSPPPSSTQNQPAPSPRNYSDINVLLQDIRDGDSEAIAYMAELN
ncbi:hypothetical protein PILCRDRAFT_3657 [Piloderma croceum F 1598]|uniref:Uncharacterized protein n=1 Tax=Piloderma croceum (strain F 1598) TaxID=765440 RepID=A0A0C3CDZ2_PILCF|nr:hypothetical protein PILCRDRAFT_3657 [Piloderma croceum F 1598]